MVCGFDPGSVIRMVRHGCGYFQPDRTDITVSDPFNPSKFDAARRAILRARDTEISVHEYYKDTVANGSRTVEIGTSRAEAWKGDSGQVTGLNDIGLGQRLGLFADTAQQAPPVFSKLVRVSDHRCHAWGSLRQLGSVSSIGLLIGLASRKIQWGWRPAVGLTVTLSVWFGSRHQHQHYATMAGFYWAVSLGLAGESNQLKVAEDFQDPLDPWARSFGESFRPKTKCPSSAAEATPKST